MAKMKIDGLGDYIAQLKRTGAKMDDVCSAGVYAMAEVAADAIRANINALDAVPDSDNLKAYKEGTKEHLSITQKTGLKEGFGISPIENVDGEWNAHLGFDGYNDVRTKRYPKGQPNVLIARVVESGSGYMDKSPFVRPAITRVKKAAIQACEEAIAANLKED